MFFNATLTIEGMYNYDATLFDSLVLPEGVVKKNVVAAIIMAAGQREVVYASIPRMKQAIQFWSERNLNTWTKLLNTTTFDYDPISNYDRTERWTENGKTLRGLNSTFTSDNTTTSQTTDNYSGNETRTANENATQNIKAFNDNLLTPSTSSNGDLGENNKSNSLNTRNENGTLNASNKTTADESINADNVREGRAYGNIGVTTTQQMIREEREIVQFNIYDFIASAFCEKFILGVW